MFFEHSPRVKDLQRRLLAFMDEHIYPNERTHQEQVQADRWRRPPVVEELKARARAAGLWNLFLPPSPLTPLPPGERGRGEGYGAGLTNLEYAPLCEIMGRSVMA